MLFLQSALHRRFVHFCSPAEASHIIVEILTGVGKLLWQRRLSRLVSVLQPDASHCSLP